MNEDLQTYLPWLQGRKTVSIPELQLAAACSYLRAKEILEALRAGGYVSRQVSGIHSPVNVKYVSPRSMTEEEVRSVFPEMSEQERTMLGLLVNAGSKGGYCYDPMDDFDGGIRKCLELLYNRGMVHEFSGLVFPSVDAATHMLFVRLEREQENEYVSRFLAQPMIDHLTENPHIGPIYGELSLLPEFCKQYIRKQVAAFRETGAISEPPLPSPDDMLLMQHRISAEMLRALMLFCPDEQPKEMYVREVRACLQKMRMSELWDDMVLEAGNMILEQLESMEAEEIWEMQRSMKEFEE